MINKKELMISLIILVFGFVILGFVIGWENMLGKLNNFKESSSEEEVDFCSIACAKMDSNSFCIEKRNIEGKKKTCAEIGLSCDKISC